ncbi:MAG: MFS transporter, partial [Bacteroidetes bacterium]
MSKQRKHPRGLYILFFTEMWERFGFYLMLGIFTLYMIAGESEAFPGLGMSNAEAADIYGTYLALVYLTPFIGGLLADRVLGYNKSIYIGGALMALGYLGLAIPNSMTAFYLALLLIILGNGLFKPNISVLLGKLYETPEFESKKDAGFNIFYM